MRLWSWNDIIDRTCLRAEIPVTHTREVVGYCTHCGSDVRRIETLVPQPLDAWQPVRSDNVFKCQSYNSCFSADHRNDPQISSTWKPPSQRHAANRDGEVLKKAPAQVPHSTPIVIFGCSALEPVARLPTGPTTITRKKR